MRIVLLQDVKGLGKRMEVKEVKEGYARNFLIARGFARIADAGGLRIKKEFEAGEASLRSLYGAQGEALRKSPLEFVLKSGNRGEVFGSVAAPDIEKALADRGIRDAQVELSRPLREAGEYGVQVRFKRGVRANVTVLVRAAP